MSRIQSTFSKLASQKRKALIPYITAGDPKPGLTVAMMHALVKSGADMIELGVPFSDPMADGPVIQRASERALIHGVGLNDVLEMVRAFRTQDTDTPVILMGYANPVEAMGVEVFVQKAKSVGLDGVLTVDYPPEECLDFVRLLKGQDIDPIFLLSPTTDQKRINTIVHQASGFIYYVSLKGVTGSQNLDITQVTSKLENIRGSTSLPIGVGFGVRDAETAKQVAAIADAIVVGSRMVLEVEKSSEQDVVSNLAALTAELRNAIDSN